MSCSPPEAWCDGRLLRSGLRISSIGAMPGMQDAGGSRKPLQGAGERAPQSARRSARRTGEFALRVLQFAAAWRSVAWSPRGPRDRHPRVKRVSRLLRLVDHRGVLALELAPAGMVAGDGGAHRAPDDGIHHLAVH